MTPRTCILIILALVAQPLAAQWQQIGVPRAAAVYDVAAEASIIAVAADDGMRVSTDTGRTWHTSRLANDIVMRVVVHDATIYASAYENWRSTDHGRTWERPLGLHGTIACILPIGNRLLAASRTDGLFESVDGGAHWESVATTPGYSLHALVADDTLLFAAGENEIVRSADSGRSWFIVHTVVQPRQLLRTADALYATAASGVVLRTRDHGATWEDCSFNHPTSSTTALFELRDTVWSATNDGLYHLAIGDSVWQMASAESGCAPLRAATVAAGRVYTASLQGLVRRDGATNWTSVDIGGRQVSISTLLIENDLLHAGGERGLFLTPRTDSLWLRAEASDLRCGSIGGLQRIGSLVVAHAGSAIVHSHDSGRTWRHVAQLEGTVTALAGEGETLIAGTYVTGGVKRLHFSTDRGALWWRAQQPQKQTGWFTRIMQHRGMWFAGAIGDTPLLRSLDGGRTWHPLDNSSIWQLLAGDSSHLYAYGNPGGYAVSTDGGDSWSAFDAPRDSFFNANDILVHAGYLFALSHDRLYMRRHDADAWSRSTLWPPFTAGRVMRVADGFLWVGTDTSGVWRYPLADILGVAPADARVPSDITIVGLSPHPVHGELMVEFETRNSGSVELDVWDALGRHVMGKRSVVAAGACHREHVALPPTSSGIHLLRLRTAHGATTRPFLVM
jgi:photosystem II stability/assembly factor-like uncharacterized protein